MITVHPSRYSTSNVQPRKNGIVFHDSESGDGSTAALLNFLTVPGDRLIDPKDPTGRRYGSSYHALANNDLAATWVQVLGAETAPFHAPPLNQTFWGFCIPGYARQTRAEWFDAPSLAGIRAGARFAVEKAKSDGFPLVRLDPAGLRAGGHGYCGHVDVSDAFGKTDHYDPGPSFPWDVLHDEIMKLLTDPEVPMSDKPDIIITAPGRGPALLIPEGPVMTGLSDQSVKNWKDARGAVTVELTDVEWDDWQVKALVHMGYGRAIQLGDSSWAFQPNL